MRAYDIIKKKRDGAKLSEGELEFFLSGYQDGNIPEYQMSAFLMAVYFQGMDDDEVACMTSLMLNSGSVLELRSIPERKIDKHSTGGVGDKISLVLAPLVACAGVKVPMISGRGLGCTGGTLDKLESVPGYNVRMSVDEFERIVREVGCAIIGTTGEFVPLDRKLYALRDVTATTEPIQLIASSIMSKKLAEGIDGLVLDVRCGSGGNVKDEAKGLKLANLMVAIGRKMGKDVVAILTDMTQPTGHYVGNALEMYESVLTLMGKGPSDLKALVVEEGAHMTKLAGIMSDLDGGRSKLGALLDEGAAVDKFAEMIEAQGGDPEYILRPEKFLSAKHKEEVLSPEEGFVSELHAEKVGLASIMLGAGRESMDSVIDHAVGVEILKKVGDEVEEGSPLAIIHFNDDARLGGARRMLSDAYGFSKDRVSQPALIKKTI